MSISPDAARYEPDEARYRSLSAHGSPGQGLEKPLTLNDHLRSLHGYDLHRHFRHDETIFAEGEPADRVYRIITGIVRLCRYSPSGRRHIADFVIPGDVIGFLECADQPATAEAVNDVTLISYSRANIDRLASADPKVRTRVLYHLSENLLDAQHQLFVLGCQNAKERVASFLVRLADRTNLQPARALALPMGRQDIADHLGLSVETISRVITALKNDGAVSVPNSHELILTDMRALRALAFES